MCHHLDHCPFEIEKIPPTVDYRTRMSCDRSLQLSLISFKERVTTQQKRIEDLERENRELRARLSNEADEQNVIRQLEEANLHLRQRNLELTQALLNKNMSLSSIGSFNEGCGGGSGAGESLAAACDDVDVVSDVSLEDASAARLEQMNMARILEVKRALLDQQKTLMAALHKAREAKGKENKEDCGKVHDGTPRCCPMCEAAFPEEQVSLEDFESHVLDHFSCEDRSMDTIHNFDLMLDAPSSFDGDFG